MKDRKPSFVGMQPAWMLILLFCLAFVTPCSLALARGEIEIQHNYQVRSDGETITFPNLFTATPVVVTSAHYDGRPVLSAASRVTVRDFVVSLKDRAGRPASFVWVEWIAFIPSQPLEVIGGILRAGDGRHVSFKPLSSTPVIVVNAFKDGLPLVCGVVRNAPGGFDLVLKDLRLNSVKDASVRWMAVIPRIDNGFRGGFHTLNNGGRIEMEPAFSAGASYLASGKGDVITGAAGGAPYGFTVYLRKTDGSPALNKRIGWLGFGGFAPSSLPSTDMCHTVTEVYQTDLCKIKKAGIPWVRIDADEPDAVTFARQIGLDVIVVMKSETALADHGPACAQFLGEPLCMGRWQDLWEDYVRRKVTELKPFGVKIWQADNELNNPLPNPHPAVNPDIRRIIVTIAARTIRALHPDGIIAVNLYAHVPTLTEDIRLFKTLRDQGIPLDMLGMDYFSQSYAPGNPGEYPEDLKRSQSVWDGPVMIMETGLNTFPPHTMTDQDNYVKATFRSIKNLLQDADWFKGIMWYEYQSNNHVPIKDYFGLNDTMVLEPKSAWYTFIDEAYDYRDSGKMIGITYRQGSPRISGGGRGIVASQ